MFLYIPAMEGEDELAFDFTPLSTLGIAGTLKYLPMEKSFPFLFPEENKLKLVLCTRVPSDKLLICSMIICLVPAMG